MTSQYTSGSKLSLTNSTRIATRRQKISIFSFLTKYFVSVFFSVFFLPLLREKDAFQGRCFFRSPCCSQGTYSLLANRMISRDIENVRTVNNRLKKLIRKDGANTQKTPTKRNRAQNHTSRRLQPKTEEAMHLVRMNSFDRGINFPPKKWMKEIWSTLYTSNDCRSWLQTNWTWQQKRQTKLLVFNGAPVLFYWSKFLFFFSRWIAVA